MKRKPGPIPSRLPRRYKRGGKEIGSFFIRIKGQDVNLWTKDAEEARQRAKEAFAGKRFKADGEARGAAQAIVDSLTGTESATTPPVAESPPAETPPPTVQAAPPPAAALPPIGGAPPPAAGPVKPDGYIPPPPGWADSVRSAASSTEGAAGAAAEDDDLEDAITPDMLEDLLDQAADVAVGVQIELQAWVARRGWAGLPKIKTGDVPADGPGAAGRRAGRKLWKRAFKKVVALYMPDLEIPIWLAAPAMVAFLTIPVQLEGAELLPDDAQGDKTQATEASAAA